MQCPKCGSESVSIQLVQDAMTTKKKSRSGLRALGRATMVVSTGGLWALTGHGQGKNRTKITSHKEALRQDCGYDWKV